MARARSALSLALGAALRLARAGAGLSQEALAARAGIDRSYCGALERGEYNPTYETLLKIADGLEVPLHELFARAGV